MKSVTVCLNMIVKNEAHVIRRCLENVRPLIHHWVIVDTGSTDGTQSLIKEVLADIPGTLYERSWVNFGHNRTEAVALARDCADYILTIDADEQLEREDDFLWGDLSAEAYSLIKVREPRRYRIPSLVRGNLHWKWIGALHEYIDKEGGFQSEPLDGIKLMSPREGARANDPDTYRKDALLLERAVAENPNNKRDVFYLAQSYRDCEAYDEAIKWYQHRIEMCGWIEEVYVSALNIARIRVKRSDEWPLVISAYLDAHNLLPARAEALFDLGMCFSHRSEWANAWLFLSRAAGLPLDPTFVLFVEENTYQWLAKMQAAVAAHYAEEFESAARLNRELLSAAVLPEMYREQVQENLRLALQSMPDSRLT